MDRIINGYIMPHPPILLPEIGRGEEKKALATINGCLAIAGQIADEKPETIVVITPHGPVFRDAVCLNMDIDMSGSFARFGQPYPKYEFTNDLELSERFSKNLEDSGIVPVENDSDSSRLYNLDRDIDHGALVPLYFISKEYKEFKLVHLTYGTIGPEKLYRCGIALRKSIEETGRKAVVIASSDLSHRLSDEGPYEYNPAGSIYDGMVVQSFRDGDFSGFLNADNKTRNNAGECGHRSMTILLGVFEGRNTRQTVHSYEGPFGVGYMTATIEDLGHDGSSVLKDFMEQSTREKDYRRKVESEYVKLARKTIREFVVNGNKIEPDKKSSERKGVFVSIKKHGSLRGCIGTISPATDCVEQEIVDNAISAAVRDPRFNPIEEWELEDLEISVDILHEPEKISSKIQLDTKEYGVIVRKGARSGLLLPNLEGIDNVDEQVSIALRKAGINEDEDYKMERFRVERFR